MATDMVHNTMPFGLDHADDWLAMGGIGNDLASLTNLALGPVDHLHLGDVEALSDALHATIESSVNSPAFSSSESSSSDGEDLRMYPSSIGTPLSSGTPVSAEPFSDGFIFDWSPTQTHMTSTYTSSHLSTTPPFSAVGPTTPFVVSPERPYSHMTKSVSQPPRQPRNVRPKQPKPFKRRGRDGDMPTVSSKLASALLPKVDKPSLGELNGKMPRPVVVSASPRRRRKTDKVTDEQIQAEEEARKIKSVQSARDCRKRKKQYIQGLQLAIQQYEQREAAAQQLIKTLESSISRLKMSA